MILTPKNKKRIGHIFNIVLFFPIILIFAIIGLTIYDSYIEANQNKVEEIEEWNY